MKKILSIILVMAMLAAMLCACSQREPDVQDTTPPTSSTTEATPNDTTPSKPDETEPAGPSEEDIAKIEADDRVAFESFLAMVIVACMEDAPYNAMSDYVAYENVSCYVDNADLSVYGDELKVTLENCRNEFYQYNDEARKAQGVEYTNTAGNMFGFTVTFYPQDVDGVRCYVIKDGIMNQFIKDNAEQKYHKEVAPDYTTNGTFGTMIDPALFNLVTSSMGNTIKINSDRYKNSPVTAFFYINEMGMINATYSYGGEFITD